MSIAALPGEHLITRAGSQPSVLEILLADLGAARDALEAEEQATPRLSPDDIARFDRKSAALGIDDAQRWRAAHIALRIALERHIGPALRGIAYAIAPGGRPHLPRSLGLAIYPDFSLAHAGNVALIAISGDGAVGADIEVPRDIRMPDVRRQRIIRAATRLAPEHALPDEDDARLLQSWVRLEAFAKATGLGIGRILTEAGVVGGRNADGDLAEAAHDIRVADLALGQDLFAAVAAGRLPENIAVTRFPTAQSAFSAFVRPMPQT